jgi:hypothetical protein
MKNPRREVWLAAAALEDVVREFGLSHDEAFWALCSVAGSFGAVVIAPATVFPVGRARSISTGTT